MKARQKSLNLFELIERYTTSVLPGAADEKQIFENCNKAYLYQRGFFTQKILAAINDGKTILMHAVHSGNPHIVRWVLTKSTVRGKDNDPNINQLDSDSLSAIDMAIVKLPKETEEKIELSSKTLPPIETISTTSSSSKISISNASTQARHPQIEIIEMILNVENEKGERVLTNINRSFKFAATLGKLGAIKLLAACGAHGNDTTCEYWVPTREGTDYEGRPETTAGHVETISVPTALDSALENGHYHVAEYLSQQNYGAVITSIRPFINNSLDGKENEYGNTLLMVWQNISDYNILARAYKNIDYDKNWLKTLLRYEDRVQNNPGRQMQVRKILSAIASNNEKRIKEIRKDGFEYELKHIAGYIAFNDTINQYLNKTGAYAEQKSSNNSAPSANQASSSMPAPTVASAPESPNAHKIEEKVPPETNPDIPDVSISPNHRQSISKQQITPVIVAPIIPPAPIPVENPDKNDNQVRGEGEPEYNQSQNPHSPEEEFEPGTPVERVIREDKEAIDAHDHEGIPSAVVSMQSSSFHELRQQSEAADKQLEIALTKSKEANLLLFDYCAKKLLAGIGQDDTPERKEMLAQLQTLQKRTNTDLALKMQIKKFLQDFEHTHTHISTIHHSISAPTKKHGSARRAFSLQSTQLSSLWRSPNSSSDEEDKRPVNNNKNRRKR